MMFIDCPPKVTALLMLVGFVLILRNAIAIGDDFGHCETVVKKWEASSVGYANKDKHTLKDLLFFLHVPRTGGRAYFYCFLKKLYPVSQECPRSYDKLRFDPSKEKCRLLVTHDDYSMMSKLPKEKTSLVTILRNPVDRVFSTYEFSIEVAARFLVHPNLTSATQMLGRLRARTKGVSTLDIWPWKYLVPWMRQDLFARRDARRLGSPVRTKSDDSYDVKDTVMPLRDYINDPIAHDIIHNGATFQVAGLTNNSYLSETHQVRHCVGRHKILGEYVLRVAKKRLDDMLYIGLTEEHKESATMFANVVAAQAISLLKDANSSLENVDGKKSAEQGGSGSDSKLKNDEYKSGSSDEKADGLTPTKEVDPPKNMTVRELVTAYEECIGNLRSVQARRRTSSLKKISPVNFSKEARLQVPEVVLQQIRSLNQLDLDLYDYARDIFKKEHENWTGKHVITNVSLHENGSLKKSMESRFEYGNGVEVWRVVWLVVSLVLLLLLIVFLNSRTTTSSSSKIKLPPHKLI